MGGSGDGHNVTVRPPLYQCMLAGGIGGCTGDMLMHSLDTVKTRQQGAPNAIKYETLGRAYTTIFREEGFRRGLYGGVTPAFLGSLPGTMIFFATYEWSKRHMLQQWTWCPESVVYLSAGFLGDLFASVVYVPSEVLKTRLQLQGRYNNPYFQSGYNYRSTFDAARTIVRTEGWNAMFYGYKATLMRDLPFSALQFAFWEQFQKWAKASCDGGDIGLGLEILTGGAAGGLAGTLTTPLDVVKTRIQTQVRTDLPHDVTADTKPPVQTHTINIPRQMSTIKHLHTYSSAIPQQSTLTKGVASLQSHLRSISTGGPSTTPPIRNGAMILETDSILTGLRLIFRHEGVVGLFRGVFPRGVWTSIQSGTMLVMYQTLLKSFNPGVAMEMEM
ncbi:hypothetical protein TWF730_010889 [Orbilia blumenaviensis]|uniref:Mitochondrial carrier protein n=2 Tax=Orbilia blumenaviensis TaxID=1796055 RepID=A0AAV9UJV0_9PEZI